MSQPRRVQMTSGSEPPADAVVVGRPSKWGNPISFSDVGGQYPSLTMRQVGNMILHDFRDLARRGRLEFPNWRFAGGRRGHLELTYPPVAEIRAELAGLDLACWCPLDEPCHADVLLEIANGEAGEP